MKLSTESLLRLQLSLAREEAHKLRAKIEVLQREIALRDVGVTADASIEVDTGEVTYPNAPAPVESPKD